MQRTKWGWVVANWFIKDVNCSLWRCATVLKTPFLVTDAFFGSTTELKSLNKSATNGSLETLNNWVILSLIGSLFFSNQPAVLYSTLAA